jgi:hypothetical protein
MIKLLFIHLLFLIKKMRNTRNSDETIAALSNGFEVETNETLHPKYVSLFIIESILFFLLGYYLWFKAKNHIKPTKIFRDNQAIQSKYEVFYYLSIANISKLLI